MSININKMSWLQKQEREHIRMQEIAREELFRQSTVNKNMGYEPYRALYPKHPEQAFTNNKKIQISACVDDRNEIIAVRIDKRRPGARIEILS